MAYEKIKKSFTIDGVDYKDIIGLYESYDNRFSVRVAGNASMIRQYLKAKHPKFTGAGVLWVTSSSFANGNSTSVNFNRIPENYFETIKDELEKFEYGWGHFASKYENAEFNGMKIDYGTKYLSVSNQPTYDSKEYKMEAPDWDAILKSNEPKKIEPKKTFTSPSGKRTYSSNTSNDKDKELLYKFDSGWELYKTILADTSFFYTIEETKEVKRIKYQEFSLLKGKMLTQEGFKWNPSTKRFEKWNKMDADAIPYINKTLTDAYGLAIGSVAKEEPTPTQDELPFKVGDYFRFPNGEVNKYLIFKINSISDTLVFTTFRNLMDNSIGDIDYDIEDLKGRFNRNVVMMCDYDGNPIKATTPPPPTSSSKEEVSKAIKALTYLAQTGDADAEKAIKALKYLI
jgi:hypothetical protein